MLSACFNSSSRICSVSRVFSGLADAITKNIGTSLIEAGDREAGIRIFRSVPLDPEDGDDLAGLVAVGDFKTAEADLQAVRSKYPQGTLSPALLWTTRGGGHRALPIIIPSRRLPSWKQRVRSMTTA